VKSADATDNHWNKKDEMKGGSDERGEKAKQKSSCREWRRSREKKERDGETARLR